jgi:hypothetical protein
VPLVLDTLNAEIATIVPIVGGFAPFGLADKLNGGGAISARSDRDGTHRVRVRDGGRFVAHSERAPRRVFVDGVLNDFSHTANQLRLTLAGHGAHEIEVVLDG